MSPEDVKRHFRYDPETGVVTMVKYLGLREVGEVRVGTRPLKGRLKIFVGRYVPATHIIWAIMHDRYPLPGMVIDHKDNDPSNDRFKNLQEITKQQNTKKNPRQVRPSELT